MIKTFWATIVTLFALSLFSVQATAATETQCGPTICYQYDDAQAATALFGQPTLVGDTIRFLPPNFRAQSDDGAGFDTATANFIFDDVYSISGADIGFVTVVEAGDYEITNGDFVSADLFVQIASNTNGLDFTTMTDSFDASGDSGGLQRWQMDASILPLVDPGDLFGTPWTESSSFSLNIQNTLQAFTDANGESAWIQKKITLAVSEVPVPAAVWLFGSALMGLGWMRRRQ
ncbi:MAG: VPLPA-CTERM sorting domain-containing protein [Gammaproteobacteria bacterium]